MERITREEMLMEVAHVVARRGTCSRAQVGVVFARKGRILATGYNGAPRGLPHCDHKSYYYSESNLGGEGVPRWLLELHEKAQAHPDVMVIGNLRRGASYHWDGHTLTVNNGPTQAPGCTVVEHSERNAIAFAAREGIRLGRSDAYCTHAPCLECSRALLNAGIRSLTFEVPYRITAGVELLRDSGVEVVDLGIKV